MTAFADVPEQLEAKRLLEASLGLAFPRAVARLERGDDVVVSGLWAGLSLAVAIGDERR